MGVLMNKNDWWENAASPDEVQGYIQGEIAELTSAINKSKARLLSDKDVKESFKELAAYFFIGFANPVSLLIGPLFITLVAAFSPVVFTSIFIPVAIYGAFLVLSGAAICLGYCIASSKYANKELMLALSATLAFGPVVLTLVYMLALIASLILIAAFILPTATVVSVYSLVMGPLLLVSACVLGALAVNLGVYLYSRHNQNVLNSKQGPLEILQKELVDEQDLKQQLLTQPARKNARSACPPKASGFSGGMFPSVSTPPADCPTPLLPKRQG